MTWTSPFRSHYAKEIQQSASSKRPHGSFVHLAKELAVLSTSLPPGIWIRHDEERVDVIKCVLPSGLLFYSVFI